MVNAWQMLGLGLDYVFATVSFFIFLFFMKRISDTRKTTNEILPFLGIALEALFMSIAMIISSWFDYYRWKYSNVNFFLYKLYTLFVILAFMASAFLIECVLKKTKYAITSYMILGFIITIFTESFEQLNTLILYFAAPAILIFLLLYYHTFIKPTSGYLRKRMISALIGFVFIAIGMISRNDILILAFGDPLFSIATCIAIIGISLILYGFSAFSTFTDLKWQEKSRELYVILDSGICLYAFSFEKKDYLDDTDLIAGGFSGIRTLLSEMVKTQENLRIIDYQNLKIMLEQHEGIVFILVIKENSSFLPYKLKIFSSEFLKFYKDVLENWNHEVSTFYPTKTIIENIFEIHS